MRNLTRGAARGGAEQKRRWINACIAAFGPGESHLRDRPCGGVPLARVCCPQERQPVFRWSMDFAEGPGGTMDYTRTRMRMHQSGTKSSWSAEHTVLLLVTVAGTFVYRKK